MFGQAYLSALSINQTGRMGSLETCRLSECVVLHVFQSVNELEVAQSTDACLEALALCACPAIPSLCMALEITLVHCGRQQAGLKCQDETAAKWPALGWPWL